jgi:hypothetical protein
VADETVTPPSPPAAGATVTGDLVQDRVAGLHAFQQISQAFAKGFDDSEPQAYGRLLNDLMHYGALFVSGGLMSAKELLDKMEDLQQHIRKGGTGGRSMPDLFHDWLNDGAEP